MFSKNQSSAVPSLTQLLLAKSKLNGQSNTDAQQKEAELSDIEKALKAMKNYPLLAEKHRGTALGDSFSVSNKVISRYYIQLIHREKIDRYIKQSKYKFFGNKITHEQHQKNVKRLMRKRIINVENIMGYRKVLSREVERRNDIKKGS